MPNNTKPAYNPADSVSQAGTDSLLVKMLKMGLFCAAPAIIETFDRTKARATVKPAFMAKQSDGSSVEQDYLYDVPVRFGGGGGFAASLPLQKGDTGWLIFCDRDLSAFKENRTVSPLNTDRMHAQEDSFFLPDAMQSNSVSASDDGKAVFQALDGSVKVAMSAALVEVLGNLAVTGNISATGSIQATGSVEAGVDVVAGGISLKNHVHGGVTGGTGTTGGPQ
ncbi:hypothetical protein IKD60_01155 [Candidatus Saccharibacteria bacterium]|nr:hypothetical protein [Candidatus Saccharibacteria bacterium]